MDDLNHIFKVISDDAKLSKWAGGLGNDWTNIRSTGAMIRGTNGESQGVVPFLKVANDTAVAVNQGGKRKGAMCAYLETWHLDIEDFLELRKNTGDERRRTHDMNTANWIPDLFMKRVVQNAHWTLFNPSDCPDLHDLYGRAFEERYTEYEAMADRGEIPLHRRIEAVGLVAQDVDDALRDRPPVADLQGPVEHLLAAGPRRASCIRRISARRSSSTRARTRSPSATSAPSTSPRTRTTKTASTPPCWTRTVRTAMRMLDNVIDINYYPTPEARHANMRHRPVGLGLMGFQDALYKLGLPYASDAAVEFADRSMEIDFLPRDPRFHRAGPRTGHLPDLSGQQVEPGHPADGHPRAARSGARRVHGDGPFVHAGLGSGARRREGEHGMRNSNTMAIAPTATISNISGVSQSIEPMYKHLFAKSNLSGEFTTINVYLIEALKKLDLWDAEMVEDLKYYDGVLSRSRAHPRGREGDFPHGLRDRAALDDRVREPPPEVDRHGPIVEPLPRRAERQKAQRHVHARLAQRAQDDVLPAHARRHADREEHGGCQPPRRAAALDEEQERQRQRQGGPPVGVAQFAARARPVARCRPPRPPRSPPTHHPPKGRSTKSPSRRPPKCAACSTRPARLASKRSTRQTTVTIHTKPGSNHHPPVNNHSVIIMAKKTAPKKPAAETRRQEQSRARQENRPVAKKAAAKVLPSKSPVARRPDSRRWQPRCFRPRPRTSCPSSRKPRPRLSARRSSPRPSRWRQGEGSRQTRAEGRRPRSPRQEARRQDGPAKTKTAPKPARSRRPSPLAKPAPKACRQARAQGEIQARAAKEKPSTASKVVQRGDRNPSPTRRRRGRRRRGLARRENHRTIKGDEPKS